MKIMMATGGSGGHIFPALKVAQQLRTRGHEVLFAGVFPNPSFLEEMEFPFFNLNARGISFKNVGSFLGTSAFMGTAITQSFFILRKFKPDVICGFGGYGSFPIIFIGSLCGIPSMLHEQNVVPGKANRVLSRLVKKIGITFPEGAKGFKNNKTVVTGCPTRAFSLPLSKAEILKKFNLDPNKRTIMVAGGSQGSHRINKEFIETIKLLKKNLDFQVIHICGNKDYEDLKVQYQSLGIKFSLHKFLENLGEGYQVCDLIVCRAGAVSVLEIAQFGIPAVIFIPYPFAGGHQKANAEVLTKRMTAGILEEKDLTPTSLAELIISMTSRRNQTHQETSQDVWQPDAASRIAKEILSLKK